MACILKRGGGGAKAATVVAKIFGEKRTVTNECEVITAKMSFVFSFLAKKKNRFLGNYIKDRKFLFQPKMKEVTSLHSLPLSRCTFCTLLSAPTTAVLKVLKAF